MTVRTDAAGIFEEYRRGMDYKRRIGLYGTVRDNENFYIGRQWEGLYAPDLDKPVLNILKRAVGYFVATAGGSELSVRIAPGGGGAPETDFCALLEREVTRAAEADGLFDKLRGMLRSAAVDGDGCLYFYYRPPEDGSLYGRIVSERVDNTSVFFGNMAEPEVSRQPYVILAFRESAEDLREEAKRNGVADWSRIAPDGQLPERREEDGLATVLLKFFKRDGRLYAVKTARNALVRPVWATGGTRYPLIWLPWETVRQSYHGEAAVTGLIPNQIIINKLFAMYVRSVETNAFPKIVYDMTKFGPDGWSGRVGEAVGVAGDVSQAAVNVLRGGDTSAQVMEVIRACVELTRDCMGATDAALGNVRAEDSAASAILANQKASAAPLALQKRQYLSAAAEGVRVMLDLMAAHYGIRPAEETGGMDGVTGVQNCARSGKRAGFTDFSEARAAADRAVVTVGAADEWSEAAQLSMLDTLAERGILTDAGLYLESVPDRWLPAKRKLLETLEKAKAAAPEKAGAPSEGKRAECASVGA